jgi:hypothetical protein
MPDKIFSRKGAKQSLQRKSFVKLCFFASFVALREKNFNKAAGIIFF